MTIDGLIQSGLALVMLVIGGYVKHQDSRVGAIEQKLDTLPDTYARKDDVKDGFSQINRTLERIEDRLYTHGKADSN